MSRTSKSDKKPIEQYDHKGKERCNNPPVGLVTPETDSDSGKKTYAYDPHLDPALVWAGKAEHTSFEIPTVSLHVHERIDPRTIIEAVRKRNGTQKQMSLFEYSGENPPLREAIEFYKHKHNWSNRMIAGDSLLVMNSLLEKQRLMTAAFDYYELAHPDEGVGSGFKYKTVPHIMLKSIANNEPSGQETLYDQPFEDNKKARVSGPFTVEAVPAPVVKPLSEIKAEMPADESVARSGETLRQSEWRAELLKCGIRGKNRRIAVKIVDDRGIESLKIVEVK